MNCSYFKRELDTSHTPALLGDDSRAHAARCRVCAARWQEHLSLNRLLRELDPIVPPADFDSQLRVRLRASKPSSSFWSPGLITFPSFARVAVSCTGLMLLAVALYASLNDNFKRETADQIAAVKAERIEQIELGDYNPKSLEYGSVTTAKDFIPRPAKGTQVKPQGALLSASSRTVVARRPHLTSKAMTQSLADVAEERGALRTNAGESVARAPLTTSQHRIEVTRRDARGEREAFLLDAVSFGGQPLVQTAKLATAGAGGQQGVW